MANEFKPNWTLSKRDKLTVALSLVLYRHWPEWPGGTDAQLAQMADEILAIVEAPDETSHGNS